MILNVVRLNLQGVLPLINPGLTLDDILTDDNDGVLNGNLLEFKLRVNDLNAVLFQCVEIIFPH